VTFGAVARSRNQNFTIGDGKRFDGTRARTPEQLAALDNYSDRLRDYCHFGDPICAVGSQPVVVNQHLDYFILHNEEVVSWVTEKAKASTQKVSDDNTSTSSVVAKSAAIPTPTPSIMTSKTQSATDSSEAPGSAQTGETTATGAASGHIACTSYAPFVAVVVTGLTFAF
jgi:hypothetical protein